MLLKSTAGPLRLLPEAAVLAGSTLVAADIHLGKSAAFRANGIPIPEGDTARDLARLVELVSRHQPSQLVIAGDLFHSTSGTDASLLAEFHEFLVEIAIPVILATGNHDQKIRRLPTSITRTPHLDLGGLRIVHDPADASPKHFNVCGHIHPVVRIPDGKRSSLRLPCFHLRNHILTLPSFGSFTGGQPVEARQHDRFFVALNQEVIEIPRKILDPNGKN